MIQSASGVSDPPPAATRHGQEVLFADLAQDTSDGDDGVTDKDVDQAVTQGPSYCVILPGAGSLANREPNALNITAKLFLLRNLCLPTLAPWTLSRKSEPYNECSSRKVISAMSYPAMVRNSHPVTSGVEGFASMATISTRLHRVQPLSRPKHCDGATYVVRRPSESYDATTQ